jgi:dienelactone hydrolase/WD40 repeat protein
MLPRAVRLPVRTLVILLAGFLALVPAIAQERRSEAPRALTAADYARAEKFLGATVTPLVVGGSVSATWLPDERFWYRSTTAAGSEFILVDPAKRTRAPAFDHVKLAAALSAAAGAAYTASQLPFQSIDLSPDGKTVSFNVGTKRWSCDVQGAKCTEAGPATAGGGRGGGAPGAGEGRGGRGGGRGGPPVTSSDGKPLAMSPDGKRGVFIREWNLWVRDVAAGQEKQLTSDGVKYFGYATDNAGWSSSDRAIVFWSPDSKKIATFQQDERSVGEMYLVNTPVNPVGHPTLRISKFPLPGDPVMAMLHRVIIGVDAGHIIRFQMPPDYHRATLGDNFSVRDLQWSPDTSQLAFISTSRDHKQAVLRVADAATGSVRTVMEETVPTQYESRAGCQVLWATGEVIWYSERDNWGHLYLYDLTTGKLKNQITTGEGPVMQIVRVDEKSRTIWFAAQGREKGEDPYFRHFYRIGMDGKNSVSLTPDEGDHAIQLSPSGRSLIDTCSRPDVPPVVTLRDGDGKLVMALEKADISKLLATGWKPPIRITMKAHDGKTDIYGLMFRPTNFDPAKKYPIVNNVYPGPQTGSTGSRSFTAARGDRQALAELGFIVVTIDGMGTPGRSKAFQDAYYGAMGRDNTIPDQIAGMKELAQKYPWIDIDRAGIWGHSGGGFATTTAMFRFPDFFKVGIAESGNHDQRVNEDDWGERYQGLLVRKADGTDNYEDEANQKYAGNLKGHLLLAHGTMDTNVPPYQTLLIADALIKANKDFDLLMLPNQGHGYGTASGYMMRRRWDYFVKWLLGAEPPKEYQMQQPTGGRGGPPTGTGRSELVSKSRSAQSSSSPCVTAASIAA